MGGTEEAAGILAAVVGVVIVAVADLIGAMHIRPAL
jgi:hypothetical protein